MKNIEIDWNSPLPYNHSWVANVDSIMDPRSKITWPQLVAEFVVFWRSKFLKSYVNVKPKNGWWKEIEKDVRKLNQQSANICNYFPHPKDEPLVVPVFKNYFRSKKPLKIGQFRNTRSKINTKTGKVNCTVTKDEKNVVLGLMIELERAIETRNSYINTKPKEIPYKETKDSGKDITLYGGHPSLSKPPEKINKKGSLAYILSLEENLNKDKPEDDKPLED